MNDFSGAFAEAAEAMAGVAFRLHGRDPLTGLDCVGLLGAALIACGRDVRWPVGYRLRNTSPGRWIGFADLNGLIETSDGIRRGDILLTIPGPAQYHLLIALGRQRFVHAHAGLRRVVIQHLDPTFPLIAHWRLAPTQE